MKNLKSCITFPLFLILTAVLFLMTNGCTVSGLEIPSGRDAPGEDTGGPRPPEITGVEDGGLYRSCTPVFDAPEGEVYSAVLRKENGEPTAFRSLTVISEDGHYTLTVCAEKDGQSANTIVSFTIDGTPPEAPSVSGKSPTNDFTPTWEWTASDDAIACHYCIDGGVWTVTDSPSFTPCSELSKGTHVLQVRAQDGAGNISPCTSIEVIINPFIYVATRYGFNYSFDDGDSFRMADIPEPSCKSVFGENGVLYVATEKGAAILENVEEVEETGVFKKNYSDDTNRCNNIFVKDRTVYIATDGGIGILYDGLQNFKFRTTNDGLGDNKCRGIYTDGDAVYVATIAGVGISRDGGNTFINVTNGLATVDCRDVFAHEGRIYAATWNGIGISDDGPLRW